MASDVTTLESLPNEILISILSAFPTATLLPLSAVSRRFHALVLRLLSHRLAGAVSAQDSELILECYHPSAKLSTPYLHCEFLGSGPLGGGSSVAATDGPAGEHGAEDGLQGSLGELRRLYSRFRPLPQENDRALRQRRARAASQQQHEGTRSGAVASSNDVGPEPPSLDVHLDEAELFTQLCTVTNLVKTGPRRGLFTSHVNISDGLIRVWRDWLSAAAEGGRGERATDSGSRAGILWADPYKHVGVRFRVVEITDHWRTPLLVSADDESPVSYRLEYEDLVVRTSHLLLMTEKSEAEGANCSADATVFAQPPCDKLRPAQALFYPTNINLSSLAARDDQTLHRYDDTRWDRSSWIPTLAA